MKLPDHLQELIKQGEGLTVEFKKSTQGITKDVYETICAFSNRIGGHIFLGVKDDGTILGVDKDCIDKMKKDFVNTINNGQKLYPQISLSPEEYEVDGKSILYVHVPEGNMACRCEGRFFDRNEAEDVDITHRPRLVYRLFTRKSGEFYINKVFPRISISDLRHDLMDRVRHMANAKSFNHRWMKMTDEEMLRDAGLILEDPDTNKEGLTLAAVLLFGTDKSIMSTLFTHRTDAIFRVFDMDHYDDRDMVETTNLLDMYDRLMAFGKRHLFDVFGMEGNEKVNVRDKILHEIISNSLMHRDYSGRNYPQFVIECSKIVMRNPNMEYSPGNQMTKVTEPFDKNPPIAKVFREIGLAGEPGSGLKNLIKYTKMYSGGEPTFEESDEFICEIPITKQ